MNTYQGACQEIKSFHDFIKSDYAAIDYGGGSRCLPLGWLARLNPQKEGLQNGI
ncbi:MAG: hypothetical protein JRE61_13880 [Deltaproteobacteria bacterium]|nr:hypothetical protein [Deltaproteobacteria bacterium]